MKYNYSKYIGTEWKSGGREVGSYLDCWGIVWAIYNNEYEIYLPKLEHIAIGNGTRETTEAIESVFPQIYKSFEAAESPKEGSVIMMRMAGHPIHIGVAISDNRMIHSIQNAGCVVENFKQKVWEHRIEGFYNHKDFV